MDSIKIVFFDIDGTLVDPRTHRISPKTVLTLKRLRQRGVRLVIATGRPTVSLPDFGDLAFDAFVTFNGSLCYAGEEIVYQNPIPPADVAQLISNAAGLGRPVAVAVRDRMEANGVDRDLADYYALANLKLEKGKNFEGVCREPVYQIMLGYRPGDEEAILRGTKGVKLALSWDRAVDVVCKDNEKGKGVRRILEYFRIDPAEALAFGDSYNDLDMLRAVGTGVAMGNGKLQLKALAKEVCLPVWEDGIYHYCLDHNLI